MKFDPRIKLPRPTGVYKELVREINEIIVEKWRDLRVEVAIATRMQPMDARNELIVELTARVTKLEFQLDKIRRALLAEAAEPSDDVI